MKIFLKEFYDKEDYYRILTLLKKYQMQLPYTTRPSPKNRKTEKLPYATAEHIAVLIDRIRNNPHNKVRGHLTWEQVSYSLILKLAKQFEQYGAVYDYTITATQETSNPTESIHLSVLGINAGQSLRMAYQAYTKGEGNLTKDPISGKYVITREQVEFMLEYRKAHPVINYEKAFIHKTLLSVLKSFKEKEQ